MDADGFDLIGEEPSGIPAGATRAIGVSDVENLVHSGMKCLGFKYLHYFINYCLFNTDPSPSTSNL